MRFNTEVKRIARDSASWQVHTTDEVIDSATVVIATGHDHDPFMPSWPGRDGFTGDLIHASAYVDPEPFRGRDVLVVGPGVTGTELAFLISEGGAARVRIASRTPPHFYRRKWLGLPPQVIGIPVNHLPLTMADAISWSSERMIFGDLTAYGLPKPPIGAVTRLKTTSQAPACDAGFVSAVKAGRITVIPAVEGFDGPDVLLADGARTQADAVIAATGYRRALEPLLGDLDVIDERGAPRVSGSGQHPSAPGLYFTGYRAEISGQMRLMRHDARAIARAVPRHLKRVTSGR